MNPYNYDYRKLKESKKITDPKDLLKLRLIVNLKEIILQMETPEVLELTGLDKADLSRIRCSDFTRFSIDRIISLFHCLGYKTEFSFKPLKKVF